MGTCFAKVLGLRMLLRFKGGDSPELTACYVLAFERLGALAKRVEVRGRKALRNHLDMYNRPDVALDTYPNSSTRLCRKSPPSARERAIFSPGKDGEAGDIGFIVDGAGCSQAGKGPLEARASFPTEPGRVGQSAPKSLKEIETH